MARPLRTWALLALTLTLAACGGRGDYLDERVDLLPAPVAIGDALLFVDRNSDRGYLLEPDSEGGATELELPHGPSTLFVRNGTAEALLLSSGRRASSDEGAEPASLSRIDAEGQVTTYVVESPFDSLSQSDDGRYALLFKSGSAGQLLDNPNEIAIVDLEADPDDGITLRTLRSFGDSPVSVIFSPQMQVVGEARRLAVVLSETNVTLLDLDHLDRRETTVQLSTPGGAPVLPTQVVFGADEGVLYVRGNGSDDLFVFNLAERIGGEDPAGEEEGGDGPRNDFRPSINQLGVGAGPTDLELYDVGAGNRLMVVASRNQLVSLVEASTSRVTQIPLEAPGEQALMFEATSPRDQEVALRALVYQTGSSIVSFLDLEDAEARGTRNLETLALDQPITKLIPMLEEQLALVIHDIDGISLIDLADRTISPIRTNVQLQDAIFDAERRRLWVAPQGQPFVGLLDLDTGDTDEVLLDAAIGTAVPMFDAGRLAIVHSNPLGHVTWLELDDPSRDSARSVRGFLFDGLLERGE